MISFLNYVDSQGGGEVLCKSLGGGVLLGHCNPHPITRSPRGGGGTL